MDGKSLSLQGLSGSFPIMSLFRLPMIRSRDARVSSYSVFSSTPSTVSLELLVGDRLLPR